MAAPTASSSWTRDRILAAVLLLSLVGVMGEVRWEHRQILKKESMAWLPIFYSAGMLLVGTIALAFWSSWGRGMLSVGFLAAAAVGILGLTLHNAEHPERVLAFFRVWGLPAGNDAGIKVGHGPPVLAPGAFLLVGLLGWFVCRKSRT